MKIEIREYENKDFKVLLNIIRETWNYDRFSSPKTAVKLAKVFLSSCLTNQTFSRVAVLEGKPVGIILCKNAAIHKCPVKYRLKQVGAIASLFFSGEGRKVSKIFESVGGIDKQLLKECGKDYPAELALFAVDSACRGRGIGKMLFQAAEDYFREQNLEEFYLFTDTSCNYGFYEHQGMMRRCEKEHNFHISGQDAEMHFFIYDYQIGKE